MMDRFGSPSCCPRTRAEVTPNHHPGVKSRNCRHHSIEPVASSTLTSAKRESNEPSYEQDDRDDPQKMQCEPQSSEEE